MYGLLATSYRTRTAYNRFTSNRTGTEKVIIKRKPGNNGHGDGDGHSHFGRGGEGGAPEDAAVLVTLLVAVDALHEKQFASERGLQERYATAWWRRPAHPTVVSLEVCQFFVILRCLRQGGHVALGF